MSDTKKIPAIRKGLAASLFRIRHSETAGQSARAEGIVVDIQRLRQQLSEVLELDPDHTSDTLDRERQLSTVLMNATGNMLTWLQDNGIIDADDRTALYKIAGEPGPEPPKQGKETP